MENREGSAFGIGFKDWTAGDRSGHEIQGTDSAPDILDAIDDDLAGWLTYYMNATAQISGGIYGLLENHAQKLILTAAVNDFVGVVRHALHLDGRSAAHSARVLFEHVVNLYDITGRSENTPARYSDHRVAVEMVAAGRRSHLPLLPQAERRKEAARLDALRKRAAPRLARAIKAYGSSFKRQWAKGSLADRAAGHGLGGHYDGYRVLSAVIHGSSGSMAGLVRDIKNVPVHRTGNDLELAAVALFEGLTFFKIFMEKIGSISDSWEARNIVEATDEALSKWPTIRNGFRKLDRKMWPTEPDPGPAALIAFYPSGERWYYYQPIDQTLILAHPPHTEPQTLDRVRRELKAYRPEEFGGRPMTALVPEVRVESKEGHREFPASAIMVPFDHPAARKSRMSKTFRRLEP